MSTRMQMSLSFFRRRWALELELDRGELDEVRLEPGESEEPSSLEAAETYAVEEKNWRTLGP